MICNRNKAGEYKSDCDNGTCCDAIIFTFNVSICICTTCNSNKAGEDMWLRIWYRCNYLADWFEKTLTGVVRFVQNLDSKLRYLSKLGIGMWGYDGACVRATIWCIEIGNYSTINLFKPQKKHLLLAHLGYQWGTETLLSLIGCTWSFSGRR